MYVADLLFTTVAQIAAYVSPLIGINWGHLHMTSDTVESSMPFAFFHTLWSQLRPPSSITRTCILYVRPIWIQIGKPNLELLF